jgi:hypothetical protein
MSAEPRRRWFIDEYLDLIVWYSPDDEIIGFKLCFDKDSNERALHWMHPSTSTRHRVDDGESNPTCKGTPILLSDGMFGRYTIADRFLKESSLMEIYL